MADQSHVLRERLVEGLKARGFIRSASVEAAFRQVPRHAFLPGVPIDQAYTDRAFPTKHRDGMPISSSSQPAIMAIMLEQLGLQPGQRVLEVGAGTGYNAALMAYLVGERGHILTVDIDDDLAASALRNLAAAGFQSLEVICADGGFGYPAQAPYDRIILTVGTWDIAPAWIEQLARDGRLVLPLSLRHVQKSVAFEWRNNHLESVSIADCGFMRLRGAFAGPERVIPLGPSPGPRVSIDSDRPVDSDLLFEALTAPGVEVPTGLQVRLRELFGSLSLWLAVEDPDFCSLGIYAEPAVVDRSPVPLLFEWPSGKKKERSTMALLGQRGFVALARPSNASPEASTPLSIVSFGAEADLVNRMRAHLVAWDTAGRPSTESLRISAYPKSLGRPQTSGGRTVEKHWTTLVISAG